MTSSAQFLIILVVLALSRKNFSKPLSATDTSQTREKVLQDIFREESQSIWMELQNSWKHADPTRFPKVVLTPKQQAWFNSFGNRDDIHEAPPKGTRKEIRQLSSQEFEKFFTAVHKLQTSFPDPEEAVSEYGLLVKIHRPEMSPSAHLGAAFLPWHREYLWRMEQALRAHDPEVSLPYWDATLDQPLPEPRDSVLWSEQLMGNVVGQVITGPFANWSLIPECDEFHGGLLVRNAWPNFLGIMASLYYNDNSLQSYWNQTEFGKLIFPEFPDFENEHGSGHFIVNGHMTLVPCSPSDPIFWMHHCFIDFIWEEFRQHSQTTDRELDYPTSADQDIGGSGHDPYSYMEPFRPLYNIHGLSNHYTNYYYTYESRNVHCSEDKDCNSPFLWCDETKHRCTSKVHLGGKCNDLPNTACYGQDTKCVERRCT